MGYKKILVAVDRFQHTQVVIDHALDMARKENAELMIFSCVKQYTTAELQDRIGTHTELDQSEGLKTHRRLVDEEIAHVKAWVNGLIKKTGDKEISVETMVEEGIAGPKICKLAKGWGADLVVIGRTRRSKLTECVLGSVSNHVIHHTPCSVLLVY